MTLYLDASALTKAFLVEASSTQVLDALAADERHATTAVAYAELRAAFARSLREGRVDATVHDAARADLEARWPRITAVGVEQSLLLEAAEAVDRHPRHALRALDSIHLASALRIATGDPSSVTFACWDLRLWRAARDEGFTMLPPTEPT